MYSRNINKELHLDFMRKCFIFSFKKNQYSQDGLSGLIFPLKTKAPLELLIKVSFWCQDN